MVVHSCNPSTQRWRDESQEFKACLGYMRPHLKQNKTKHKYKNLGEIKKLREIEKFYDKSYEIS